MQELTHGLRPAPRVASLCLLVAALGCDGGQLDSTGDAAVATPDGDVARPNPDGGPSGPGDDAGGGGTDGGTVSTEDVPFNPDELPAMPSGTRLELRELARDRLVYDSGAAFGRHWGFVPVGATTDADDGTPVSARAVAADGEPVTPWGDLGTVVEGSVEGDLVVPLDTRWLHLEVRIKGTEIEDRSEQELAVGHVAVQDGQSDVVRAYNFRIGGTYEPEPILDPEALQMVYMARPRGSEVERFAVNDGLERALRTPGAVALSNTLATLRPGEKFMVVVIAQSGMGLDDQLNDSVSDRDTREWADERAIAQEARMGGVDPGFYFYYFSSGTPTAWFDVVGPGILGLRPDGSPFRAGDSVRLPRGDTQIDHVLTDIWDMSKAKLGHLAPWNGELREGIAEHLAAEAYAPYMAPVPGGALASRMVSWAKGNPASGWSDTAHATASMLDGAARLASILGHLMLIQWGLTENIVPQLERTELWPNGDRRFVAVSFADGLEATTLRNLRGGMVPSGRPPVLGFTIDGDQATRTSIRNDAGELAISGRIWIQRNDGRDWTGDERLQFGSDRYSFPADRDNGHFVEEHAGVANAASELLPVAHAQVPGWNTLRP